MNRLAIGLLAASAVFAACRQQKPAGDEPQTPTPAQELRERLAAGSADGKILFGHHDDPVYGHDWKFDQGRSDVKAVAGRYPAMMSWDLGRIELGDSLNIDGVPFDRIRNEVRAQNARGGINTFSWHLWNPVNGGDSWQVTDSTIVAKMANDSTYNNLYRQQVRAVADFLGSLTDENGNRIGVIFRPWHENSGGWFFWGAPLCSAEDYHKLWTDMRDEMDAAGIDNVLYAYSPDRTETFEGYMSRYPGDELVDILGMDIYHFGGEAGTDEYRSAVTTGLGIVRKAASEHGKIAAFTETGMESVPMAGWWTEVLLPLLKENPVSYVVVWRNAHDRPEHFYAPYPGQISEDSFKTFAADSTIILI